MCGGPLVKKKFVTANTRRPSGHCASASIHREPVFVDEKMKLVPKAGSCPCASQTTRARVKSRPATVTAAVTDKNVPAVAGTEICAVADCQACVAEDVPAMRNAAEASARAWFTMVGSVCTFQLSPQRSYNG